MSDFQLPRDERCVVVPHDHPELFGDNRLIRRIHKDYVVDGQEPGSKRLSSALFKFRSHGGSHLSFDSEPCILAKDCDPAEYVCDPKFFAAVVIRSEDLRSVDTAAMPSDRWKVGMVPVPGNDCHAGLWGQITKGQSNAIQRLSEWLIEIPGVTKLQPEAT